MLEPNHRLNAGELQALVTLIERGMAQLPQTLMRLHLVAALETAKGKLERQQALLK